MPASCSGGTPAGGGVEGTIHAVLALVFFAVAALAIVEILKPSPGLAWGRIGAQILLGSWFIVGAWIIYRSGWDLADAVRRGWTYTVFSWTAAGASISHARGALHCASGETGIR